MVLAARLREEGAVRISELLVASSVLETKSGRGRAQEARAALAEKGTLEGRRVLTWFSRLPGNGWDGLSAGFVNLGSPALCADRTLRNI